MVGYARVLKVQAELSYGMVTRKAWKFGGTRPGNAPDIRILQFAEIIKKFDFETSFLYLSVTQLIAYIDKLLDLQPAQDVSNRSNLKLTKSFKELLLINWIVPYMYWYGQTTEDESIVNNALEILAVLPPEKNGILKKWNEFGRVANNAADSQALLEIFNEFCTKKKCLSCSIGYCLLNK